MTSSNMQEAREMNNIVTARKIASKYSTPGSYGEPGRDLVDDICEVLEVKDHIINDLRLKIAGLYGYADLQGMLFVKHIKSHLEKGQYVICKICGKTVEEIALDDVDNDAPTS